MTSTERPDARDTVRYADAPARTDVPAPREGRHTAPAGGPSTTGPVPDTTVRALGAALAIFSGAWAVAMLVLPEGGASTVAGTATAVAFQGSLLALLALMWRTRATGERRAGRILLGVEAAVLALATVQSASEAVPGAVADTLTVALDPFWPLSMLGMMITGITVACVGRWRGAARVWAPVATSWIALLPTMAVLPMSTVGFVMTGHILVGYVVLGVVLAVRPDLTRR